MVRTYWKGALVAVLALPVLAFGQNVPAPAPLTAQADNVISVKESGKPEQRCKVLKVWKTAEGAIAREVQALDTGEVMTIVDIGPGTAGPTFAGAPSAPAPAGIVTRIFRWGKNQSPPPGAPCAPRGLESHSPTMVVSAPCVPCAPVATKDATVCAPCAPCVPGTVAAGRVAPTKIHCDTTIKTTMGSTVSIPTGPAVTHEERVPFYKRWFQRDEVVLGPVTTTPKTSTAALPIKVDGKPLAQNTPAVKDSKLVMPSTLTSKILDKDAKPVMPNSLTKAPEKGEKPEKPGFVVAPPSRPTSPAASASATVPSSTDWRRSWGKPDLSKAPANKPATMAAKDIKDTKDASKDSSASAAKMPTTPAKELPDTSKYRLPETKVDSAKPEAKKTEVAAKPAPKPEVKPESKPETKPVKSDLAAKSTLGKEAPGGIKAGSRGMDLPRADASKPNPLMSPDRYVKKPLETAPEPKKTETAAAPRKLDVAATEVKKAEPVAPAAAATVGKSSTHPKLPLGSQSVLAAYEGKPGGVCYLPVPLVTLPASVPHVAGRAPAAPERLPEAQAAAKNEEGNAFTPASTVAQASRNGGNAFGAAPSMDQQMAMGYPQMQMPMMPPMPNMAMRANMMPQGAYYPQQPYGMAMQAYFVPGMMPGQAMPAMMPGQAMPGMPAMANAQPYPVAQASHSAADMQNHSQLLLTLRDSVYPSYREWAADALGSSPSGAKNPQVVDALVTAAKEDPAATVRAACLRCLAKMKICTPLCVSTIKGLKADPDPRVRSAAGDALTVLGVPSDPIAETPISHSVTPAGATEPADKPASEMLGGSEPKQE